MTDQEQEQAKIVHEILGARTLYDVLGVDPSNIGNLRKAYLTTSVKVHPDKNQHPLATQAFQRVAEAWGTLSDDAARAEYDAELRNASRGSSSDHRSSRTSHTQQAPDFERTHNMPSFQEALFMFATATAMFAGASSASAANASRSGSAVNAAGDFMETLLWAQKLAQDRQREREYGNPDDPNYQQQSRANDMTESTTTRDPLASGMALGSGLRALAGVQRAMGMKKSATATEKAATAVQVAALGATVLKAANENPAVKRTLERGQGALQNNPQIAQAVRASLAMAGSILSSLQEAGKEEAKHQNGGEAGNRR